MSYATIYAAANDEGFQGRCMVAMWQAAQGISVADRDEPAKARMDWATRVLQDRANITPRQLAIQVLRNATIAANPTGCPDGDIEYQVGLILPDLIAIG